MACGRCGGEHRGFACKIAFGRAWPGKAAAQIRFRAPSGKEIKIESDLSPELAKQLLDLIEKIGTQPEPGP